MMNGWKVTSIIFIVIAILELMLIVWAFNEGIDMVEKENQCIYNVCDGVDDLTYIYDEYEEICECYNEYQELTKSKYMGGS